MQVVHCPVHALQVLSIRVCLVQAQDVVPGSAVEEQEQWADHQAGMVAPPLIVTGRLGAVGQMTWDGLMSSS